MRPVTSRTPDHALEAPREPDTRAADRAADGLANLRSFADGIADEVFGSQAKVRDEDFDDEDLTGSVTFRECSPGEMRRLWACWRACVGLDTDWLVAQGRGAVERMRRSAGLNDVLRDIARGE